MVFRAGLFFFLSIIILYYAYQKFRDHYVLLDTYPGCAEDKPKSFEITGTCKRYSSKNCCNTTVVKQIGERINHKNMRFDFCGTQLSESCSRFFRSHFCLEACDPYMMPFHDPLRKNKFQVPICESECRLWYSACYQEHFCARNLMTQYTWDFNQTVGRVVNNCFKGSSCRRADQLFDGSTDFCETIFNGFYKVRSDNNCVVLGWALDHENPNGNLYAPKTMVIISGIVIVGLVPIILVLFWKITRSDY